MNRIPNLEENVKGLTNPEDIMSEIMKVLDDTVSYPQVGNYYTFIYYAKTPDIIYDQHPLVAVTSVEDWGFRGFNFHWNKMRSYTWQEVYSKLHIVENDEIVFLRNIQYAKFKRT